MHLEFTLNLTIYFSLLHVPTGSCPPYPITPEVTNPSALIARITRLGEEQLQGTFEISWAAQFDFSPKTDYFNPFFFSVKVQLEYGPTIATASVLSSR